MAAAALVVYYGISVFPGIASGLSKAQTKASLQLVFPGWFRFLQAGFLCIVVMQVGIPLTSLLLKVGGLDTFLLSITRAGREIGFTLLLAFTAALAAVPLAIGVGQKLEDSKKHKIWWTAAALPLAIPAPLVGIGLVALYSKPILSVFYGSLWMPVLAALVRFLPLAVLVIAVQLKRFDKNTMDAARVFQNNPLQGIMQVRVPMMLPGIAAAFLIIFVLTVGELGATLIVVPPGYSTLTMRIYNFMHYGSSDMIAGLCVAILITSMFFSVAAFKIVTARRSLRRQI